jgi:hypothetical protein
MILNVDRNAKSKSNMGSFKLSNNYVEVITQFQITIILLITNKKVAETKNFPFFKDTFSCVFLMIHVNTFIQSVL